MFKHRYLAELTLFSTCPWMVYFDCNGVLVVICSTLICSYISHWSSHFCNVSRSCCMVHRSSSHLILRSRLIIYGFTSLSRMFYLYGDVTIAGGRLQNLGLWSALRAFELGGIFIVQHLLWHGISPQYFRFHKKDHPIQSLLTTDMKMWTIYSNPDSHGSPFSRLLRHARGC
jgi:hypothetical protein